MNMLSICPKHKEGGYYKRLYALYESIAAENHTLYYISCEKLPIKHENIVPVIVPVPFAKGEGVLFWLCFIVSSVLTAYVAARKYRVKAIFTFGPFTTLLCVLPIVFLRAPAVTFIRADNMKHSSRRIRNAFFFLADRIGLRLSSVVVAASMTLKDVYMKRYPLVEKKMRVQPNNIERAYMLEPEERNLIRESLGISRDDFVMTTSGAFNRGKNFSFLISAIKKLSDARTKLVIIGDDVVGGDERKRLERMADDLKVRESVIFCGWQEEPWKFMTSSDLFAYPSLYEGSPNALLEALGCGIPCLGSRIPEIEEVLLYDDLLFTLADPDELVRKVRKAGAEEDFYTRLKGLCRERAQLYSFDWRKRSLALLLEAARPGLREGSV